LKIFKRMGVRGEKHLTHRERERNQRGEEISPEERGTGASPENGEWRSPATSLAPERES
jgi:hypothetical protein